MHFLGDTGPDANNPTWQILGVHNNATHSPQVNVLADASFPNVHHGPSALAELVQPTFECNDMGSQPKLVEGCVSSAGVSNQNPTEVVRLACSQPEVTPLRVDVSCEVRDVPLANSQPEDDSRRVDVCRVDRVTTLLLLVVLGLVMQHLGNIEAGRENGGCRCQ
ncbi:chemotaxis protein CheA, partial [Sesbania bispinosa]